MADTDTKTISLALYCYMCQNIVGTEHYVKTLRLMNNIRDNIASRELLTIITSGSFGEGLEMRGSDLDMMYVTQWMEVNENKKAPCKTNVEYLSMETDDVRPGFSQLRVDQINNKFLSENCEEFNGKHYFSSKLYKQKLLSKIKGVEHGPCISDKDGIMDHARSFHCKKWISSAEPWITRSTTSWPSYNVKQSIIKHGVLFVPIGVKGSPKEDIEWRISFSVAEKLLIYTFTHTQLSCYALLKILLKDVISAVTKCTGLLCSYFFKTIIFWISEELSQSVWKPENLIPCFMRCFDRLIYCVEYSVCLHYFMPENNMFENKIEGSARKILLENLNMFHSYGWRCILFSDQLSNFHVSNSSIDFLPHTLYTREVEKTLNSIKLCLSNGKITRFEEEEYNKKRGVHQIVFYDQTRHQYLYAYYMSMKCSSLAQSISINSKNSNNKHQYKQYKSCRCSLLQNIHHDAVSGWLMLASFFYKTKQYNKALHIIVYSMSKCSFEKVCRLMDMSDIHYQMFKLKSFKKKKSVVQLWKILLVDYMRFQSFSELIPDELQMEVESDMFQISSIVYACFLKFLCHYHLNDFRQCQDCLFNLQLVIGNNYLIEKDIFFRSAAFTILGIALQLSGDHESARQAFMHSIEIYPNNISNTSIKRLLSKSPC